MINELIIIKEQWLWVPDPQFEWIMCRVVSDDGTNTQLQAYDGSKIIHKASREVKAYQTIQTSTRVGFLFYRMMC